MRGWSWAVPVTFSPPVRLNDRLVLVYPFKLHVVVGFPTPCGCCAPPEGPQPPRRADGLLPPRRRPRADAAGPVPRAPSARGRAVNRPGQDDRGAGHSHGQAATALSAGGRQAGLVVADPRQDHQRARVALGLPAQRPLHRRAHGCLLAAAQADRVISAGWMGSYGSMTLIDHGGGGETGWAHQSRIMVRPGQQLSAGQQIGQIGSTGRSTGPHVHFEVRASGSPRNPRMYLP